MSRRCRVCGLPYDQCKSPISHNHPSINEIKLPGEVDQATAGYKCPGYAQKLPSAKMAVLNSVDIYFPSQFATV